MAYADGIEDKTEVHKRDEGLEGYYPNIQESTPPEIEKIELSFDDNDLVVKIWASDNGGIDQINVEYNGDYNKAEYMGSYYKTKYYLGHVNLGDWGSYEVRVKAFDLLGNNVEKKAKYSGWLGPAIEFVGSALETFWNSLCEVAEAIADALELLVNWVWSVIEGMINIAIAPVVQAIEMYVDGVGRALDSAIREYISTSHSQGSVSAQKQKSLSEALFPPIVVAIGVLATVLIFALGLVMKFGLPGLGDCVMTLIATAIGFIVTYLVIENQDSIGDAFSSFLDGVVELVAGFKPSEADLFNLFAAFGTTLVTYILMGRFQTMGVTTIASFIFAMAVILLTIGSVYCKDITYTLSDGSEWSLSQLFAYIGIIIAVFSIFNLFFETGAPEPLDPSAVHSNFQALLYGILFLIAITTIMINGAVFAGIV